MVECLLPRTYHGSAETCISNSFCVIPEHSGISCVCTMAKGGFAWRPTSVMLAVFAVQALLSTVEGAAPDRTLLQQPVYRTLLNCSWCRSFEPGRPSTSSWPVHCRAHNNPCAHCRPTHLCHPPQIAPGCRAPASALSLVRLYGGHVSAVAMHANSFPPAYRWRNSAVVPAPQALCSRQLPAMRWTLS